jgi:hypothetical protein
MPYENGMQIVYDMLNRTAVVVFRDIISLHGPLYSTREAYDAGEAHCRRMGWLPDEPQIPNSSRSQNF